MADVAIDLEYFGSYAPRLGDRVSIRLPDKFRPFKPWRSRSLMYEVTSIDPLLAKPIEVTHVVHSAFGDHKIKTRRIYG